MMRCFVLVFASLFLSSMAQRPSFAGSRPIGRPDVASRFKDSTTETINNRVGVVDTTPRPVDDEDGGSTWSTDSLNLQGSSPQPVNNKVGEDTRPNAIGVLDDKEFVNRINTWPRENRPFDVVNSQHVRDHLYNQGNQNVQSRLGTDEQTGLPRAHRPPFAGSRPIGYPELSPRFQDTNVVNRAGGGDSSSTSVNRLDEEEYLRRVSTWPRENQPFDVINAQHIRDHLYNQGNQNVQSRGGFEQNGELPRQQRPSFAGSRPIGRPELANRFKKDEE